MKFESVKFQKSGMENFKKGIKMKERDTNNRQNLQFCKMKLRRTLGYNTNLKEMVVFFKTCRVMRSALERFFEKLEFLEF